MSPERSEEPQGGQVVVSVPLGEYLDLLSTRAALNRPVRTHAQAARERVERVVKMAGSRLLVLREPEVRGRKKLK